MLTTGFHDGIVAEVSDLGGRGRRKAAFTLIELPAVSRNRRAAPAHTTRAGRAGNSKNAFTLIELLTVVLIIAILMSLILTGVVALRRHAENVKTLGDAQNLEHAIRMYQNEHTVWPGQNSGEDKTYYDGAGGTEDQTVIMAAMFDSPRRMTLGLDLRDGDLVSGRRVDHWGRPFVVAIDQDGDGMVTLDATISDLGDPAVGATINTNIRRKVAIMSWGRDPADPAARRVFGWIY